MSHFYFIPVLSLLISCHASFGQKKWDGGGGSNLWSNPLNWVGNTAPSATDDVVLDNTVITTNYTVVLPATAVIVKTVTITPLSNRTIELTLPSTSTLAPGFIANGPGYGMVLNGGGVFRNASGAASGNAVRVSDSIRINNDGRYIHSSAGGHSSNVQVLSAAPGTESGAFELDIPMASSTISLSGRIFGKLSLKAVAAGGACNYTAAGTSRVIIRNNLEIGAGVNLNLNFSDTIFVLGNFSQDAGTFNVGNAPRSVAIFIRQNFTQAVGGIITETGTGVQSIVMGGENVQLMSVRGSWLNQVSFVKSGAGTVLLKTSLSLPHKFKLISGKITTSDDWLLTLQPACVIECDSLSSIGYVSGPIKKEGLSNGSFIFPVGDGINQRWLRLEQATGTFTVEHVKVNPYTLSSSLGSGLHHISAVEYWNVLGSTGSTAIVKLSFNDPHSGGVTNLSSLRVAKLNNTSWQNAGSTAYSGSPGSNGWVSSITAGGFSANAKSFALASAIGQENPLPIFDLQFNARQLGLRLDFHWKLLSDESEPELFEVQQSDDGKVFTTCLVKYAEKDQKSYSEMYQSFKPAEFYRLRMRGKAGSEWHYSAVCRIVSSIRGDVQFPSSNVVEHVLPIVVRRRTEQRYSIVIYDTYGNKTHWSSGALSRGDNLLRVNVSGLKSGIYFLRLQVAGNAAVVHTFIKR